MLTKVLILFVQTIYEEFRLKYGANKSDEFRLWYATYKLYEALRHTTNRP